MRTALFSCVIVALCMGMAPALANVVISNAATQNMNCSAGTCAPTATDAVLNVDDLEAVLASGSATVTTSGSGVQANNIALDTRLEWSTTNRLTLDAFQSVKLSRPLTVAGSGALSINTNAGGGGGEFWCGEKGKVQFRNLSGTLTINGTAYTLVKGLARLASAIAANPSGAFALVSDYDAYKDGTYALSPIPTVFSGAFNGLGHTISNLSINDQDTDSSVGLFAESTGGATLANIRLANENVQGGSGSSIETSKEFVGGLVGNANGGSITHGSTSGTVSGGTFASVGGVAGLSYAVVRGSVSSANVSSGISGSAGGLIGLAQKGAIADSHTTGNVAGPGVVGGLVGLDYLPGISRSWASGEVSGSSAGEAGGLVGVDEFGTIDRSYSSSMVTCESACGGLVGDAGVTGMGSTLISQSFATGSVTADLKEDTCAGGLVGYNNYGLILNSYASGAVTANEAGGLVCANMNSNGFHTIFRSYSSGAVAGGSGFTGGLIGGDRFTSTIRDAYWDMTTSGITNPGQGAGNVPDDPGIKGLRNEQLKSALPKGFNSTIWTQDRKINGGLPYLIANRPAN